MKVGKWRQRLRAAEAVARTGPVIGEAGEDIPADAIQYAGKGSLSGVLSGTLPDVVTKTPTNAYSYNGLVRTAPVPPCKLTVEQLRRLHRDLKPAASQAVEKYLATVTKGPEHPAEDFEKGKARLREIAGPAIRVYGAKGETAATLTEDIFENLPETVTEITFDSSAAPQSENVQLINRFVVTFDFTEPAKVADYNPSNQSTPNRSQIQVVGDDTGWVNGVYETVFSFLQDRKRKRNWGWLHSRYTYNLLQMIFALPAAIWTAYRFDGWITSQWQEPNIIMRSAVFLYVVLLGLRVYQTVISLVRWSFPLVELEGSRTNTVRAGAGGLAAALLAALVYDVLKVLVLR